jgi:hypothetical protein
MMEFPEINIKKILTECKNTLPKLKTYKGTKPAFSIMIFPQTWGSTCTAFDMTPDGFPVISGCAITEAYTVVVFEEISKIYFIYIENKPCYIVENPNKVFLTDLKNHCLESLHNAKERY